MLKKAEELLSSDIAKPTSQSNPSVVESSTPESSPGASASSLAATSNEPSASSSSRQSLLQTAPSLGSPSSAVQPPPSSLEVLTLSLENLLPMLQGNESEAWAQELLEDIPKLLQWQQAPKLTHAVRNAMTKLCSRWDVKQWVQGKTRPPAEVAGELEERMLKKTRIAQQWCCRTCFAEQSQSILG